jgi:mono/diheme cytochrome c family protein
MVRNLAILLAAAAAAACDRPAQVAASAVAEAPLERGAYLVDAVMACDNCHTPRRPDGRLDMERRFSGGSEVWDTPAFRVEGSNITPDRETGIGAWSDEELKRLMTEGIRPDGVRVAPQMPYHFYKVLTPGDLEAVVRYVRGVKPVRNAMPAPVYKLPAYAGPPAAPGGSVGESVPADPVARGAYLASLAYCMACHSRRPDGVVDVRNWWGKGGFLMKGHFGSVTVSNITSHREKGIGALSDAQLRRALTEGIGHDGRAFSLPMARQAYYSKLTEQDLDALIAWMRSIPPAE